MKRVPAFVQIAAAEITVGYNRVGAWPIPVTGSVLYALDKQGRVWRKMPSGRGKKKEPNQKWALVEQDAE